MKLSDLSEKSIYASKAFRGVCKGIALSLKSYAVKYLLCSSTPTQSNTDFAVGISSIDEIDESIRLRRLSPAHPRNCAKISIGLPIYSFEGGYLGKVIDLDINDYTATRLFTNRGESFPVTSIVACSDAVILRKEQPYPLGQRIPAPILSVVTDKAESVVTKPILRTACAKGALIRLTLSLPPFCMEEPSQK